MSLQYIATHDINHGHVVVYYHTGSEKPTIAAECTTAEQAEARAAEYMREQAKRNRSVSYDQRLRGFR